MINDIIQLLPDHVANQIAAGEVVQRPASVVKELLENAIDAKATAVQLILKDAGRMLIQVVDNGLGMSTTDARMAFERHATSKIKQTEDIFQIKTKGFRGEALASIAAVAQVELKTKRDLDEIGTQLIIEGSEVKTQQPINTATGSTIVVKNLFYNVPARRNFLKSNNIEFRHIVDEFHRVALAHEDVSFSLFHQDETILKLEKGTLQQRIVQIFGKKNQSLLVPITESTELVQLTGFVGKPEMAKKMRGEQFFFVNHRFIKSPYLNKAVQDAFENLLSAKYQASYFLYLEIDPAHIDINIHPTKTEIKFDNEQVIYSILRAAVKHALGQYNVMPSLDFDQNPDWAFVPSKPQKGIQAPTISVNQNYNPFLPTPNKPTQVQKFDLEDLYRSNEMLVVENDTNPVLFPGNEDGLAFISFQWQNRYIVTQFKENLVLIDQHRAHQKILYEELLAQSKGNTLSQQLLFPIEIELPPQSVALLKNREEKLLSFGFDIYFEEEKIALHALPASIKTEHVETIFNDFLAELDFHEEINLEENFCKSIAKATAVKKGDVLGQEEINYMVQHLFALPEPMYTPFGKNIFTSITLTDIDKKLN